MAILVILQAVGFDDQAIATGVGMVYVVDRILDMSRTAINVLGDSCAAAIIGKQGESEYYTHSDPLCGSEFSTSCGLLPRNNRCNPTTLNSSQVMTTRHSWSDRLQENFHHGKCNS